MDWRRHEAMLEQLPRGSPEDDPPSCAAVGLLAEFVKFLQRLDRRWGTRYNARWEAHCRGEHRGKGQPDKDPTRKTPLSLQSFVAKCRLVDYFTQYREYVEGDASGSQPQAWWQSATSHGWSWGSASDGS